DGTPNDMGVGAKVTWGGSFTSLDNRNTLTVTVKTKPRGSSTWTTVHSYNAGNTGSVPTQSQIFSSYSELLSHDFRVEFKDAFNTTISLNILPTGLVTMSWGKAGIGVGKAWERGTLDVQGDFFLNNIPQGIVEMGSNSNGTYLRYSDGTQICFYSDSSYENIPGGDDLVKDYTFPASFKYNNVVVVPAPDSTSFSTNASWNTRNRSRTGF